MVNRPVGPPGEPPLPPVGAMLRGSPSDRSVCAVAAAHSVNNMSANQSALLASLIAFLLRNEYGTFAGRGDHAERVAGSARRDTCWFFIASEHPPSATRTTNRDASRSETTSVQPKVKLELLLPTTEPRLVAGAEQ